MTRSPNGRGKKVFITFFFRAANFRARLRRYAETVCKMRWVKVLRNMKHERYFDLNSNVPLT
jgi:hypothetical protein